MIGVEHRRGLLYSVLLNRCISWVSSGRFVRKVLLLIWRGIARLRVLG